MCNQSTLHDKFRIDTGRTITAVNPMDKEHKDPCKLDLTKPRFASYKQKKWKRHQDTVYWVNFQLAQRKGLKFYQTRCNAIIFCDTLPASCIPKVVVMESGEIIFDKVCMSPRPPPKISFKDNWTCELDSDIARSSRSNQRIELKPNNTELSSTGKVVTRWRKESLERTKFDRDTLSQEKHDEVRNATSTEKPVSGHESTKRCVLTPRHVENDQTGTEKPVTVDQKEEHKIDFRVPGLSHSVVKEAEHIRVQ